MDEAMLASMTAAIVDEVQPTEVILFGSHARGTARPDSDIDLIVVVQDSEEARRHRRKLTARLYRRFMSVPLPMDILVYTQAEADRWRKVRGHVVSTGLVEGRRLYVRP